MVDSLGHVNAVAGSPEYNGRMLRQLNAVGFAGATAARPLGARSGVRPGTSAATVTANSTTWTCQPFAGLLDGQVAAEAGPYPFAFDAVATGPVTAADGSNPRIDIIYVDVDDPSEDASSVPAVTRKYLAGDAAAVPSAPSAPAGCVTVAHINVPKSGGGSPTVTWVAPYCAAAGGTWDFNTKAEMDAFLTANLWQKAKVLATGVEYVWDGTAWVGLSSKLILQRVATPQSIPNGTSTVVTFDATDLVDTVGGAFTVNRATGLLTCVTAGTYRVHGIGDYTFHGTGIRQLFLDKAVAATPTTFVSQSAVMPPTITAAGVPTSMAVDTFVTLAVGDVIRLSTAQSSGGALNLTRAFLEITKVV